MSGDNQSEAVSDAQEPARRDGGHLSDATNTAPASQARVVTAADKRAPRRVNGVWTASRYTRDDIKQKARQLLKISFNLNDVQAETVRRMDMGYDVMCIMGTGYGKSIIYETLAAINEKKVVIVICPLKALEYDQVAQAQAKGLRACALNEDTATDEAGRPTALFGELRQGKHQLVYVSPEMALSDRFLRLMNEDSFQRRVKVTVIDEAHVIPEWASHFRTAYAQLCQLRSYTAEGMPFAAFSATITTKTFGVVWDALKFGQRPFWGIDAGVIRPNLTYIVKRREKVPVHCMNALSLIPDTLDEKSTAADIPKGLFYFEAQPACLQATHTIRRCLPGHLRASVRPYYSISSAEAKDTIWTSFSKETTRIVCATDAAGMGCNIGDIQYCALFDIKAHSEDAHLTVPRLSQRWGRTGRSPDIRGICVLFAPEWAFRPTPLDARAMPAVSRILQASSAGKKERLEPAKWTQSRESLPEDLEQLINLDHPTLPEKTCIHVFKARLFRPDTGLTVYRTLDMSDLPSQGPRALKLPFPATWIVVDLKSAPSSDTCCSVCNPSLLDLVSVVSPDAPLFQRFAKDFRRGFNTTAPAPRADEDERPASRAGSEASIDTEITAAAGPVTPSRTAHLRGAQRRQVKAASKIALRDALRKWRREVSDAADEFTTAADILPDSIVKLLCERAEVLANCIDPTIDDITRPVKWEMATVEEAKGALDVVNKWVATLPVVPAHSPQKTPASQRRPEKRQRTQPASPSRHLGASTSTHMLVDSQRQVLNARPSPSQHVYSDSGMLPASPTLRVHPRPMTANRLPVSAIAINDNGARAGVFPDLHLGSTPLPLSSNLSVLPGRSTVRYPGIVTAPPARSQYPRITVPLTPAPRSTVPPPPHLYHGATLLSTPPQTPLPTFIHEGSFIHDTRAWQTPLGSSSAPAVPPFPPSPAPTPYPPRNYSNASAPDT